MQPTSWDLSDLVATTTHMMAVQRRRHARPYRDKNIPAEKTPETESLIKSRMEAVAARMVRRFIPSELQHVPLFHRYDFWSLRRLGYDALSEQVRWAGKRNGEGKKILCEPEASEVWKWWTNLHWRRRLMLSGSSRYILNGLCRAQEQTAYDTGIHNPNFEIVRKRSHDFTEKDFSSLAAA